MFEKTLDAAIAKRNELSLNFDAINEQIKLTSREIVDVALKEIGTAGTTERDKLKSVVDDQLTEVKRLVEATRETAQDVVRNTHSPRSDPYSSIHKIKILGILSGARDWMTVPDIAKSAHISDAETIYTLLDLYQSGKIESTSRETSILYRIPRSQAA